MEPRVPAIALLVAVFSLAHAAELRAEGGGLVLANEYEAVTVDEQTGALLGISASGCEITRAAPDEPAFDIRLDEQWLIRNAGVEPKLVAHDQPDDHSLRLTFELTPCEVRLVYRLAPDRSELARTMTLTYRGAERAKLKGIAFLTPGVICEGEGSYTLPRQWPPQRTSFGELSPGVRRGSGVGFAPAYVVRSDDRAALWMSDGRVDQPSITVTEGDGRVAVEQYCDALGWLDPGDEQEIGTAYLEVVSGGEREARGAMWAWMERRGVHVPDDRPDWMRDAVLYSFHPGGTIGSNFSDLGGFRAATEELLPTVADLGATAIWIMPIEDASVYHPRDYYQFQPGLGTGDEYRELVATAHGLGLHVLQDIVPHGGRNDYPRAKEHPEWLVYDEEGKTLDYWCYDFGWPSWQEYMAEVAAHYVREYDVDGYRIDACYGSRVPNWNRDIPYARASMADLQGGLGMVAAIRDAVKRLKPEEGAVLAETESPPHSAVSDSQYDFALCYSVLHGLRRDASPEEFVGNLKAYLEEQRFTNPAGTLLLRHIESHDSLRSQGWYGVSAMRALMALAAWIDGIPLVYHEQEVGHRYAFRRIFEVRKLLPELRRGEAHYLATSAEPGSVFTCLRTDGERASIVAINLSPEPVSAHIACSPEAPLPEGPCATYDAMGREWVAQGRNARGVLGRTAIELAPWGYTVLALRSADLRGDLPASEAAETTAAAESGRADFGEEEGAPVIAWGDWRMTIDRRTGLPSRVEAKDGTPILGAWELIVDGEAANAGLPEPVEVSVTYNAFGERYLNVAAGTDDRGYSLEYWVDRKHNLLRVRGSVALGEGYGALVAPVLDASGWRACTAEGTLADDFHVLHKPDQPRTGSIYWRPQGTNVMWESRRVPPYPRGGRVTVLSGNGPPLTFAASDSLEHGFENVQLLDKLGGREGLHAVFAWRDPEFGSAPVDREGRSFELSLAADGGPDPEPAAVELPGNRTLRHTSTDWVLENDHYRLTLRRTGGAWRKLEVRDGDEWRTVAENLDLYTDNGFGEERLRYDNADDVECGSRVWWDYGVLHLRFWGQMRGFQRFDLTRPPVEYYVEYAFGDGPSFRQTWGVRTGRVPSPGFAFLAAMARLPEQSAFRFTRDGEVIAEGSLPGENVRAGETKRAGGITPEEVLVLAGDRSLVRLSDIRSTAPLDNVFLHRTQTFLAWLDTAEPDWQANRWHECSALVTPGAAKPAWLRPPGFLQESGAPAARGLVDGSFEESLAQTRVSLTTGRVVGQTAGGSAWQMPGSAWLTTEITHDGRVSVRIDNRTGAYDLIRQPLRSDDFPPGSRVRLSAWIKGQGIIVGDPAWKAGVVRLACHMPDGSTQYVSPPYFNGTFDWQQVEGVVEVPADTQSLQVEVGLNGSLGTVWIDDVRIERE